MATEAHCAYCFESLSASLEKRAPLSLTQVEALWKQYNADDSETEDPAAEDDDDDENLSDSAPADPRPAAVSRLLAPSLSTNSSSSTSVQSAGSTPSGVSEASSATSKSSSRSSFFSALSGAGQKEKSKVDEHPLFVTWNTITRSGDKRLRGCIGTFEAQELDDGLRSYALTSAFDDVRFSPITPRELPTLETNVTLLTHFEPAATPLDWTIGTHGLRLAFTHHGRRYGSTYLPDVAKEQGWTKEETLVSLMRKAGWSGRKEDWASVQLNVVRYQGKRCELGYREWREWRDWVEETGRAELG